MAVTHSLVDDVLLALGNAGRDEGGAACGLVKAARFLLGKALRVFAVTDHGEAAVCCDESCVTKGVAGDFAVCYEQATLNGGQRLGGSDILWAFAP